MTDCLTLGVACLQVDVKSPVGKMLARQLSIKVEAGHSLLVTGPNGSGKSSVVRILGGLWPLMTGTTTRPGELSGGRKGVFYVPQKPYTTVGTLREQVGCLSGITPLLANARTLDSPQSKKTHRLRHQ